ncbi:cyclin-D3-1-like [Malania oleifera]|uniref:cyclin-D3-1-like n=1 Tax=Malania oleifera TaxID=397392 RepID=UPI0025ADB3B8|nr:cyclin-D3-1-like [Malania oleifera]
MAQTQTQEPNAQEQQRSMCALDALYCEEERLEEGEEESYYSNNTTQLNPELLWEREDLCWEDNEGELECLLSKEEENNRLLGSFGANPSLVGARREAVEWMLKVNAYYSFSALTALLAVNYLDRFLSSFRFQREKPWMTQLAAVACLSLAAKVEETQVPLLLYLQVEDAGYVFEAKTIQKMEILVLSTLQWKMNPVTPMSFLDLIARMLGLKGRLCWEFLRRCDRILLSIVSESRSMCYLPSVIAMATMLQVINSVEPCVGVEYQNQLLGILRIDKDKVDDCRQLILELAPRGDGNSHSNKRKHRSEPGSPNGVIDASFSCDSSNDSWAAASSVSSSPVPLSKKSRAHQGQHQPHCNPASAD